MKNFKSIINIIIGILIAFSSICLIVLGLDAPLLLTAGFIIAPASIIYFNKKCNLKALKYSLCIVGIICISTTLSMCTSSKDKSADEGTKQEVSTTEKTDEIVTTEEDTTSDKVDTIPPVEAVTSNEQAPSDIVDTNTQNLPDSTPVTTVQSDNNNSNSGTSTNIVATPTTEIVYWTPNGKSYHSNKSCSTLSRSKNILSGTQAESGKSDPCDKCY